MCIKRQGHQNCLLGTPFLVESLLYRIIIKEAAHFTRKIIREVYYKYSRLEGLNVTLMHSLKIYYQILISEPGLANIHIYIYIYIYT